MRLDGAALLWKVACVCGDSEWNLTVKDHLWKRYVAERRYFLCFLYISEIVDSLGSPLLDWLIAMRCIFGQCDLHLGPDVPTFSPPFGGGETGLMSEWGGDRVS